MQRVLVTGAAGVIGRAVCAELISRGHNVRGFDCVTPRAPVEGLRDMQLGDLANADAVDRAVAGMDALVHLAAYPKEADFLEVLLEPNVIGVYHVLEAARRHHVQRVIVTSSCQTIGGHDWRSRMIRVDDPFCPESHYGVTKAMAEVWARYYAEQHGMSMIVVRPGFAPRDRHEWESLEQDPAIRRYFWSRRDAGRFYARCVEVKDVHFAVLFGTSNTDEPHAVDPEPARALLGYEPVEPWPRGKADRETDDPD